MSAPAAARPFTLLERLSLWLSAFCMLGMIALILAEVILRGAFNSTTEINSLDFTSSFDRPFTNSLSAGSSRSARTAPRKRMPRINALRVLAISRERLRRSVFADSRTRKCSSACQPTIVTQIATKRP